MQRGVRIGAVIQLRGEQGIAVAGEVGRGVDRAAVGTVQARPAAVVGVACVRQQAVADQAAAPLQHRQAPVGLLALLADLAEHRAQPAFGRIAPAVFIEAGDRNKPMPAVVAGNAVAGIQALARAAADAELPLCAGRGQPRGGSEHHRTTERVGAKQRIGTGHQRDRIDRRFGQHVPADDVGEGLIEAHAIQIHRHALRGTRQRGGAEAVEGEIVLECTALHVIAIHADKTPLQQIAQVVAAPARELGAVGRLHHVGQLRGIDGGAGDRCGGHFDAIQPGHLRRLGRDAHRRPRQQRHRACTRQRLPLHSRCPALACCHAGLLNKARSI